MAAVRSVIALSTARTSRLKVSASMSTKTGVAPTRAMHPAVAKNENGVVKGRIPGPPHPLSEQPQTLTVAFEAKLAKDHVLCRVEEGGDDGR